MKFATTHTTNKLHAYLAYRFHFNGKESDNEVYGEGNVYDYGFRIYNPRLGKFLTVDPLTKSFAWYTPYQFAGNKPIVAIDLDGLEEQIVSLTYDKKGRVVQTVVSAFVKEDGSYVDMALVDSEGNRITTSNVLLIHNYADGTVTYTEQDQLTTAQQAILNENLQVKSGPINGYNFNGLTGQGIDETGTMQWGVKRTEYNDPPPVFKGTKSRNNYKVGVSDFPDAGSLGDDLKRDIANFLKMLNSQP